MSSVVIVGSGLAAYTLAKELRKLAPDSPLRIITADEGAFNYTPMLSTALAKGKTAPTLAPASTAQMAEQLTAAITPHTSVTADTAMYRAKELGRSARSPPGRHNETWRRSPLCRLVNPRLRATCGASLPR